MRLLLILMTSLLVSCGGSYQADFQKSKKQFKQGKSVEGPWKGTWKSEVNSHTGPVWSIVSQNKKNSKIWDFRYRAGWGVLQFGDYLHQVQTKLNKDESLPLDAKMKLPNNFGTYAVKGTLTAKEFKVRYTGQGDKGTMTLSRPKK